MMLLHHTKNNLDGNSLPLVREEKLTPCTIRDRVETMKASEPFSPAFVPVWYFRR